MMPNRIKRPEARVLAETEFVRFAELVGIAHGRGVGDADRLRRLGRPQDGAARARLRRRASVVRDRSCTNSGGACRSTRRSTRTTGSTA